MMKLNSGTAITEPMLEPVLNSPKAVERSRAGNHSETALLEAGKPPPSPTPSRNRDTARPTKLLEKPWAITASAQKTLISKKPV